MVKTEYSDIDNWEDLQKMLDKEYDKLCKKCRKVIPKIVELEIELTSREV